MLKPDAGVWGEYGRGGEGRVLLQQVRERQSRDEILPQILNPILVLSSPHPLQALILMRNRSQLDAMTVLPLFFRLFRCQDKQLRHQLFKHIVTGGRPATTTAVYIVLMSNICVHNVSTHHPL